MKKTGDNTHRATQRGYAIDPTSNAGVLVEEGEIVPADQPVSEIWMEPIKKADAKLAAAMEEALDPTPKDVDLTQVGMPGLKAMAAERHINPKGLSEAQLIDAIKAKDDPLR